MTFDGWTAAFLLYLIGCFTAAGNLIAYNQAKGEYPKYNVPRTLLVCMSWPIITVLGIIYVYFGSRK